MNNNLNTLLTTLYVTLVDDILHSLGINRTHRPGRKPALDDAELLCLVIARHLLHSLLIKDTVGALRPPTLNRDVARYPATIRV